MLQARVRVRGVKKDERGLKKNLANRCSCWRMARSQALLGHRLFPLSPVGGEGQGEGRNENLLPNPEKVLESGFPGTCQKNDYGLFYLGNGRLTQW